jgi:acetoin:2,6-dichlorophenolindophenol oxidoreductase subunit beta
MPNERLISGAEAAREALMECMARDDEVFMMGEGIADHGHFFGTTRGLLEQFGKERMLEMPVAENGMTGIAIGAAMRGMRPVISLQRVEFILLALEQIFDNAAKMHYSTNGLHRVPLVIRVVVGRGWGQGPHHAQSLESVFAHFPGLKVIMPALPGDAKGMLIAAIEDDNPVVCIEHRWIHYAKGQVSEGFAPEALDGPRIRKKGSDITIVATSYAVMEALVAADALAKAGVSAEVIDLRVLRPLDLRLVRESVARTGRLITVDTGWTTYGIGSEIVADIAEKCFSALKAPPLRTGLADYPTPSSRALIPEYYPSPERLVEMTAASIDISDEKLARARLYLKEHRGDLPLDVPVPSFQGPF